MLIETIEFEMFSPENGSVSFKVERTDLNFEMILRNRFTRQIKFSKDFDFQFRAERRAPRFIEFAEIVEDAAMLENDRIADEMAAIDPIDEMVGTF